MSRRYTAQEMRVHACDTSVLSAANPPGVEAWIVKTMAMLRQAADMIEREEGREKKYEYGVIPHGVHFVYQTRSEAEHKQAVLEQAHCQYPIVRREVGEWEEVKDA